MIHVRWLAAFLVAALAAPLHAGTLAAKNPNARGDGNEATARACEPQGVRVQVLGSGGPELVGGRASSSYLVWIDGKARALVDLGGGAAFCVLAKPERISPTSTSFCSRTCTWTTAPICRR